MNRRDRRARSKIGRQTAREWPARLEPVPEGDWPAVRPGHGRPVEVWRSRRFLVMFYLDAGVVRMSVLRTDSKAGISWDELQELKNECGRGSCWAVECYPPDSDVVNVADMRHLWFLPDVPAFGWRAG